MANQTLPFESASRPDLKRRTVLWWGRGNRDYSRDRILRQAFVSLGWNIVDFHPLISRCGDVEAVLRRMPVPDLVWVPCFRQRDVAAAQRWARRRQVPLVFDPLISAYDKQVFEHGKFPIDSAAARRLLKWESRLLTDCSFVIADTVCHAEFFQQTLSAPAGHVRVIPVGAEEEIFVPQPVFRSGDERLHVMFYGSFIGLQGPQVIAEAATKMREVRWTFIGTGPLLEDCRKILGNCDHVTLTGRVPYETLPAQIGSADVLMGVFGESEKAGRVIPNKVYQSLACGRPVVTQTSAAYPEALRREEPVSSGLEMIPSGDPDALVAAIRRLDERRSQLPEMSRAARRSYDRYFRSETLTEALAAVLNDACGASNCRAA
ncbi:MAG: glycosyltransferase [Planctomycetaceae bacterium]